MTPEDWRSHRAYDRLASAVHCAVDGSDGGESGYAGRGTDHGAVRIEDRCIDPLPERGLDVLGFGRHDQHVVGAEAQRIRSARYLDRHRHIRVEAAEPNAVASERIALRYFARVFGVVVWLPAVRLDPGEIILRIGPASGEFIIGRYPEVSSEVPLSAADAELLRTLETDWTAATFVVHVVDDVMRWKYAKLLGNLGNSIQALVGPVDGAGELADRVRAEALEVYAAAGIDHASEGEERAWRRDHFRIHKVPGEPATMGGSSWQSLARGSGSIESDYLNGEIAVMARTVGRSAPLNATLQRVAREAAKSGAGAGSMTLAELEAQLEAELAAQPAAQLEP